MKTIVIKIGSSTLTDGTLRLSKPRMLDIVRQIATLHHEGHRVLLVSSGAQAAGSDHLGHPELPNSLPVRQMLSAVGQGQLMHIYSTMFGMYDVLVGQVLVTGEDLRRNRTRYLNSRDTLDMLLDNNIVPIINENDTVVVDEIKVGDNDNISALVAALINADMLLLLTDSDGLYNKNPHTSTDARKISVVETVTDGIKDMASSNSSSGLGRGGMWTKIQAAEFAAHNGIMTVIASGKTTDIIIRLTHGEENDLGTVFLPTARRVESRKRYLISEQSHGVIIVDEGAAKALRTASLLPIGIKAVKGDFERGELVTVEDLTGKPLARGQVNYNSQDLSRLCGIKSSQIEAVLGYSHGNAAIHHDNMALLQLDS